MLSTLIHTSQDGIVAFSKLYIPLLKICRYLSLDYSILTEVEANVMIIETPWMYVLVYNTYAFPFLYKVPLSRFSSLEAWDVEEAEKEREACESSYSLCVICSHPIGLQSVWSVLETTHSFPISLQAETRAGGPVS